MDDGFIDFFRTSPDGSGNTLSGAAKPVDEVIALRLRVGQLELAVQAVIEILHEREQFIPAEVKSRMLEIDARDGRIDGQMGRGTNLCRKCRKALHPRHDRCLYCGTSNPRPGLAS